MKKKNIAIIISVLLFSYFVVPGIIDYIKTEMVYGRCFSTPEEAIESVLETDDYVYAIDNGTGLVLCRTRVNNFSYQLLYESDEGWQVITGYVLDKLPYYDKVIKKQQGYFFISEYKGKYYFGLSQYLFDEDTKLFNVSDLLGQEYKELEYLMDENIPMSNEHYWFWCLDEIPDDYRVTINGDVIFEKCRSNKGNFFALSKGNNTCDGTKPLKKRSTD